VPAVHDSLRALNAIESPLRMNIDLRNWLQDLSLVLGTAPAVEQIDREIGERVRSGHSIRIMYGETYDRYGPTFDSLKYYFAVASIGRAVGQLGIPTILIADIASCRNEPEERHEELVALGEARVQFVRAISDLYSLKLRVIAMSEYLDSASFQSRLRAIRAQVGRDEHVYRWIRQTVPASKVAIEQEKGFAYAFEEIATIVEYDIKVGPPREKFYDEPARMIAGALGYRPLISVYLRPTFPLGVGPDVFVSNAEIEEFGVTPYKAGSKGLEKHRIILGRTTYDRMAALIQRSFVSKRRDVPNPVLEIAIIGEMARQWIEKDFRRIEMRETFYRGEISPAQLKQLALESAKRYVVGPLQSLEEAVIRK
jgi:hypothetical protein